MPKKPPSLNRQTAWAEARGAYAGCVLAGVEFRKHALVTNGGRFVRTLWMWRVSTFNNGRWMDGYTSRGIAVAAAINHLENRDGINRTKAREARQSAQSA